MVQWNLDSNQTAVEQRRQEPIRRTKVRKTTSTRKTSSRPLVEPDYNSHLLHTGRSKTISKNGKKLRIRRVVRSPKTVSKQPNFLID